MPYFDTILYLQPVFLDIIFNCLKSFIKTLHITPSFTSSNLEIYIFLFKKRVIHLEKRFLWITFLYCIYYIYQYVYSEKAVKRYKIRVVIHIAESLSTKCACISIIGHKSKVFYTAFAQYGKTAV